jgi:hypothetical protein
LRRGDGEVGVPEAEAAATEAGEDLAELMGAENDPQIEAEVEEEVFDALTEEAPETPAGIDGKAKPTAKAKAVAKK